MKTFNQYITEKIKLSGNRFDNQHNGFEYVDLGLPSGTLWATCNLGAKKPTDQGDLVAWGETRTKQLYKMDTYAYGCNPEDIMKYNEIDKLTVLDKTDDAAHVNMGGKWHIPTEEQFNELLELDFEYVKDYNGYRVSGLLFWGKNDTELFLPIIKFKIDEEHMQYNSPEMVRYWTSTHEESKNYEDNKYAQTVIYSHSHNLKLTVYRAVRYAGCGVRAVFEK
jgi:hypothetical protein